MNRKERIVNWLKAQELKRLKKLFTLFALYSLLFTARGWAQADLYPFPRFEEEPKIKKDKRKKPVEPFLQVLSKKMEISEALLEDVMEKGFGRMEAIRLILLSKKSAKPLEELAKMREKGTSFAKIAEECRQENRAIKKEAEKILKELQKELEKIKQERQARATSVAGTSDELLIKNSTGQIQKGKENGKSKPNP